MTDTLFLDWTQALATTKGPLVTSEIAMILGQTSIRWGSSTEVGINIAAVTYKPAEGFTGRPRRSIVLVNPRLESLYRIERIEALMRVGLRVWQYYTERSDYQMEGLYGVLGVCQSPILASHVRWHHLGMKYHLGQVAASTYEDRPRCPVCRIHVATGHTNPKIHDGCREYVKNVYAPALRAQRQKVS